MEMKEQMNALVFAEIWSIILYIMLVLLWLNSVKSRTIGRSLIMVDRIHFYILASASRDVKL